MNWKEFLKPTKWKILLAIVLYLLNEAFIIIVSSLRGSVLIFPPDLAMGMSTYILSFLESLIWVYPLACLLMFLISGYKKEGTKFIKRYWWKTLIFILIFNPITFRFVSTLLLLIIILVV